MVFLCGFQFFLLPFLHFHTEKIPTHVEEVGTHHHSAHHHSAHFHSEILEAFSHSTEAHPSDSGQGKSSSHSSADHDQDDPGFYKFQDNIPPLKSIFVVKHVDIPVYFEPANPSFSYSLKFQIPVVKLWQFHGNHLSRAPPLRLI